ncbi:hypothetical protein O181_048454 [Austropuccinia psidii MF-1]|uniref:Ribosomal protein mS38 C-terminal domain-containing protein n=1 Tax=Austropuccinia psidii MF-1 TaxID=1389203 RepID=A0A9Q3DT13_9BASI|nr:hypothetical protein [Austropuccinia psidii MF-1]
MVGLISSRLPLRFPIFQSINFFPSSKSSTCPSRFYSFESGGKRKPSNRSSLQSNGNQVASNSSDQVVKNKSTKILGHGRRFNQRSLLQSNSSSHSDSSISNNHQSLLKLKLPFQPLSSDHLSHLRPKTLFVDLFFSIQRPLLEIEIIPSHRRSITSESKSAKSVPQHLDSLSPDHSNHSSFDQLDIPSPSDPAFKQPQSSSTQSFSTVDDKSDHHQTWLESLDPYSAYLLTEPEGVNPIWSTDLKHYLACRQPLIPPPLPQPSSMVGALSNAQLQSQSETSNRHISIALQAPLDQDRQQAIDYLTPYGHASANNFVHHRQNELKIVQKQALDSALDKLPSIAQDSLTLTIQAARFLYSGMTANRWPTATQWALIESRFEAAQKFYNKPGNSRSKMTSTLEQLPPIRGQEKPWKSRRSRHQARYPVFQLKQVGDQPTLIISFTSQQLTQIMKYGQQILKQNIQIENVPKSIKETLERFVIIGEDPGINENCQVVELDSVFRKKKRKMKVHKYKKRRKARRTLRKRQGRG